MIEQRNYCFRHLNKLLLLGMLARLGFLWVNWVSFDCEAPGKPVSGVMMIDDPDALIIIGPGADGLPGRAGIDDGGNGVTDERTELGATGSDDVCRVVFGDEAARISDDDSTSVLIAQPSVLIVQPSVLIVQRGAFRPASHSDVVPANTPARTLVRWIDEQGRSREILKDR